jgi:hypothetical protein
MVGIGITTVALIVAALTIALAARAGRSVGVGAVIIIAVVMIGEYGLASSGILRDWQRRPPPLMLAVAVPIVVALAVAMSGIGRRIAAAASFAAIIAIQAFRFPLELVMHRAATTGLMPVQMSYSGWNFDILTGVLAIAAAWVAARSPRSRPVVIAWNVIGTLLLTNIVTIAPVFAAFGPERLNTWVADPPYVLLPGVLVPAAVFGHALTWRKLAMHTRA